MTDKTGAMPVRLQSGTFDPKSSAILSGNDRSHDNTWLVQFNNAVGKLERELLESSGISILGYIPENCLLVKTDLKALVKIRQNPLVRWTGPYLPKYRISPKIDRKRNSQRLKALLFSDQKAVDTIKQMIAAGCVIERYTTGANGTSIILQANSRQIEKLAHLPGVRWLEPQFEPRLLNNIARSITQTSQAWAEQNLFGLNQIIAVADTGLDTGAYSINLHPDFQGRIAAAFALGRPGLTNDPHGHGTHVSGTILGSGILSGANPAAQQYETSFAGFAPEARLVMQSIMDSSGGLGGLPPDLNLLFQQAYDTGARIHSNSWGAAVAGQYDTYGAELDQFTWNRKDMVIVVAAGNDGADYNSNGVIDLGSMNTPASAKNCISVGATESLRTSGGYDFPWGTSGWLNLFPVDPIKSDLISDNPQGLAAFSSRGPCEDGRIKPDIVAPGTNIISTRSRDLSAGTLWGIYNSDYLYSGGTSMATPMVSGAAAIVRQNYIQNHNLNPSSALVKATLLTTATDISPGQYGTGQYQETGPRPSFSQGWGRLNLKDAINPSPPLSLKYVDDTDGINTGELKTFSFTVLDNSIPLRAMLCWTDYPGDPAASKALVNDLDLIVQAPDSTTYFGNQAPDRLNNVEGIDLANPQNGTYTFKVSGHSIPQGPQPFALVVTGGLPNGGISGMVKTASGSPIPNALITASSGPDTFQTTTGTNGQFRLTLPPGPFTVTCSLAGWTFTPQDVNITVGQTLITGIVFTGSAPAASVSGTVYHPQSQIEHGLWESAHPYSNNLHETVTITGPPNAARMRLHFAQLELESNYDFVLISDASGATIDIYSGTLADFWTPWVDGNVIKVTLITDISVVQYGWRADKYEASVPGLPYQGAKILLTPQNSSFITGTNGTYTFTGIEPLPVTLTPSDDGMIFRPVSRSAWPQPGQAATGLDFIAYPEAPIVHVDISHTYVGDLIVKAGVGTPENPLWSTILAARQGDGANRLVLDIPVDEGIEYFPPTMQNRWFVHVCDMAAQDAGQINEAWISKAGYNWPATTTPAVINDLSCTTIFIPHQAPVSVGAAKKDQQNGTSALLWGKIVTAKFPDRIYVQEESRASGIAVSGNWPVSPGDLVTVQGILTTQGCERFISNASVFKVKESYGLPIPIHSLIKSIGGAPIGPFNPGFSDTNNLTNTGLLMRATGRVTHRADNWFYIYDGSPMLDINGYNGIRVLASGLAIPATGTYVSVTGISGCEDSGQGSYRVLRARTGIDIVTIGAPLTLFSDDLENGLSAWTVMPGKQPLVLATDQWHSASSSLFCQSSQPAAMVRNLGIVSDVYSTLTVWFYDSGSAGIANQQVELRLNSEGTTKDRFALGINSANSATHYSHFSTTGGWQVSSGLRSPGWRKFQIRLNPTGSSPQEVSFLIDGVKIGSATRTGLSWDSAQIVLGSPGSATGDGAWYDDITFGYGD